MSEAMNEVTIYGSSDDLIEVEGAIQEEFGHYCGDEPETVYLAFSDGTILSVVYGDEGIWRINRLHAGTASYEKVEATDPDGDYTDRVTLRGNLTWVVFGTQAVTAKQSPSRAPGGVTP